MMKFCCKEFEKLLNDPESPLIYIEKTRSFRIQCFPWGYYGKNLDNSGSYVIKHCPRCGDKLPKNLEASWRRALKQECGLDYPFDKAQESTIPRVFLTEEWWINRSFGKNIWPKNRIKKSTLMSACCFRTDLIINDLGDCPDYPTQNCSEYPMIYDHKTRNFSIINTPLGYLLHKIYEKEGRCYRKLRYQVFYCLECGAKLPESLASRWYKEIHDKFGVYDILSKSQMAKVPQKYLTDEWWKELGL